MLSSSSEEPFPSWTGVSRGTPTIQDIKILEIQKDACFDKTLEVSSNHTLKKTYLEAQANPNYLLVVLEASLEVLESG